MRRVVASISGLAIGEHGGLSLGDAQGSTTIITKGLKAHVPARINHGGFLLTSYWRGEFEMLLDRSGS
jgi:hypothetical protein